MKTVVRQNAQLVGLGYTFRNTKKM